MKNIKRLTPQERILCRRIFAGCFGLQPHETALIITDPHKVKREAALLFEGTKIFTKHAHMIEIKTMTGDAQEPPQIAVKTLKTSQVALFVTKFSLSHTNARLQACKAGTRIASLPGITHEMLLRTLSVNYQKIAALSNRLAQTLTKAKTIHILTPNGTDLRLNIQGRKGIADTGILTAAGAFGNLPAGEAFVAPLETESEGTLVIDGALANIELDTPITLKISKGLVQEITGRKAAESLKKSFVEIGEMSRVVAEFGIGTNPKARPTADVLESEKALGSCHIAFGSNVFMGGKNNVAFHTDGVILNPTIVVDNQRLIKNGRFF